MPWFPVIFGGFVIWVQSAGFYPATGASVAIDHYRGLVDPRPEWVSWILPGAMLFSLVALLIGCSLLLISLVRRLRKKRPLKA